MIPHLFLVSVEEHGEVHTVRSFKSPAAPHHPNPGGDGEGQRRPHNEENRGAREPLAIAVVIAGHVRRRNQKALLRIWLGFHTGFRSTRQVTGKTCFTPADR